MGSVASFFCALRHLSQLTAVHHPRAGEEIGRIRANKAVALNVNFRCGTTNLSSDLAPWIFASRVPDDEKSLSEILG
jgi:hypothetical protein